MMRDRRDRVWRLFPARQPAPAVCAEHSIIDEQRVSDYAAFCGYPPQGNQRQLGLMMSVELLMSNEY